MASVQFRTGSATSNGRVAELVVDGVDITDRVLESGFQIMPSSDGPAGEWVVQMRLASHVDADLPDAVIRACDAASSESVPEATVADYLALVLKRLNAIEADLHQLRKADYNHSKKRAIR